MIFFCILVPYEKKYLSGKYGLLLNFSHKKEYIKILAY